MHCCSWWSTMEIRLAAVATSSTRASVRSMECKSPHTNVKAFLKNTRSLRTKVNRGAMKTVPLHIFTCLLILTKVDQNPPLSLYLSFQRFRFIMKLDDFYRVLDFWPIECKIIEFYWWTWKRCSDSANITFTTDFYKFCAEWLFCLN